MDRTVPKTGSEEIELYMRTYYSLLRSTHTVQVETLEESHMAMESSLHVHARRAEPDTSALVYSSLRLPPCMAEVDMVLVGQLERSFYEAGYTDLSQWPRVVAPGRRRRMHHNGSNTLAVFIASRSDIDDLVPILTAYQIEWNKFYRLLQGGDTKAFLRDNQGRQTPLTDDEAAILAGELRLAVDDLRRLEIIWGVAFFDTLYRMSQRRKQISLQLLSGSLADYRRATAYWWAELQDQLNNEVDLEQRPVYFVSSNTHSLVNLLTGFARREEENLLEYIKTCGYEQLLTEYHEIKNESASKNLDNFLYYVLKKYLVDGNKRTHDMLAADEKSIGIHRISSRSGFDIESQVIEVNKLRADWLDSRVADGFTQAQLSQSDAVILNIDYPLGMAAYEILSRITERVGHLMGVYIMGKAATLNGRVGDVMIPNVVHDEHSQNTYLFDNSFSAYDIASYMAFGMVLDNQKAISAPGTFLQNPRYMSVFYHEGYTDIEMEAGPYLSAIYEAFRPKRHPYNEIVNLYGVSFDIGFLHYASDTPMSKGHNLGAGSLSYTGVDPTYATAVAILRRIFNRDVQRIYQRTHAMNGLPPSH